LGAVDIEHCPGEVEKANRSTPEQLKTRYCMLGPSGDYIQKPCTKEDTEYAVARTRVARGDKKVCGSFLTAEYTLLDLYLPHSVPGHEARTYLQRPGGDSALYPYAGHLDINNDGKREYIGWLTMYSSAGRGCDVQQFVQLDASRTHIARTALTTLLAENTCGDYYRAFRYQGKTYLEIRRIERLHSYSVSLLKYVVELKGDLRRYVCVFEYKDS
jgi:hypothetical protein